jgi:hypothetical protein
VSTRKFLKSKLSNARSSSKASTELQAAMNDMVAAWRELKDTDPTAKGRTFKIFSRNAPKPQNEEPAISSIREKYRNMCSHLDNYSGLFKFVPSGDKYVSLLTGTIETIVEVGASHSESTDVLTSNRPRSTIPRSERVSPTA